MDRCNGCRSGRARALALGLTLVTAAWLLAACAATTTDVTGQWRDPEYHETLGKVLVISLADEPSIRQRFEHTVSARLQRAGITAVPASDIIPLDRKIDRKTVRAAIAGRGFDTVLVSRLIGIDTSTDYIPPSPAEDFDSFYSHAYALVYSPGYLAHRTVVSIRINVYETRHNQLIWSMTSKTFNHRNVRDVIDSLARAITRQLARQGLL